MCRNIGWRTLETCVSSCPRTSGTGLTWACQWSPLAVLFHCPMCLACKIIFKSCRNVGQVWIQNLDFIKASSGTLPKWTFVWLAWNYPATGVVMFWNVSESVSCSGLMSLELKFQCIRVYLLIAGDGASWLPWHHGLEPGKSCTSGEETCLLICILCEKWQSGCDTCYIVNYWHMSCRISCTAGWHRTIVCAITLYGILIATWLEILVLIEIAADVFQCSCSFLFNLRPSGVSLCSASNPQARTGNKMWRCVTPICEEICLGLIAWLSCWIRQMWSLPTSRDSQLSTSTDTFVNSEMATLRGVLAALDSFSHCAQIWIWLHCWRKLA